MRIIIVKLIACKTSSTPITEAATVEIAVVDHTDQLSIVDAASLASQKLLDENNLFAIAWTTELVCSDRNIVEVK